MESRIGLDYIVENPEYTAKLATGNYYFCFCFFNCYINSSPVESIDSTYLSIFLTAKTDDFYGKMLA